MPAQDEQAISAQDRRVLRELAVQVRALAAEPRNAAREARIRRINGLSAGERPIVWIDEIPWHELEVDDELALRTTAPEARQLERYLRQTLYRWRHIQVDMLVTPAYLLPKAYTETPTGAAIRERTLASDARNPIVSHRYEDQLDSEAKVDALRLPVLTAQPARDRARLARHRDWLGDALPVELCGHGIYHAPWDEISMLRGVEPCLIDLIERPALMHRTVAKFTAIAEARYTQMEVLGLLEAHIPVLHCTPPMVDALPAPDYAGGPARLRDVWFRGMAQMLAAVSPEMHEAFDLDYMRPLMARCGLSYYGCCEPLDRVIPQLRRIPNLRKIGVSPWASLERSAEQIAGDYVLAFKANPAHVAGPFDEAVVRREIEAVIAAATRHGCPYEIVLKDISTVGGRPETLWRWADTVMAVLDAHYGPRAEA